MDETLDGFVAIPSIESYGSCSDTGDGLGTAFSTREAQSNDDTPLPLMNETGPRLTHPDQIVVRWCVDYFDGPLSGVADFGGRAVWYQVIDPDETVRRYVVFDLAPAEMEAQLALHESWLKHAGTRHDYTWDSSTGTYIRGEYHQDITQETLSAHYQSFPSDQVVTRYEERNPIGWFDWPRAQ